MLRVTSLEWWEGKADERVDMVIHDPSAFKADCVTAQFTEQAEVYQWPPERCDTSAWHWTDAKTVWKDRLCRPLSGVVDARLD